jgi:hypothetical protein
LPIAAQSQVEAEAKVLTLERLWGQAAQMRDTRALASIFDDSLIYVHIDGRLMSKPEVLADTQAAEPVDIVVDSSMAQTQGKFVIVTGILHLKGIQNRKPYLKYGRYLDTWILTGDHWVCVSSMTTLIRK